MEMLGIEPGASHMRSERSTTELHPHLYCYIKNIVPNSLCNHCVTICFITHAEGVCLLHTFFIQMLPLKYSIQIHF